MVSRARHAKPGITRDALATLDDVAYPKYTLERAQAGFFSASNRGCTAPDGERYLLSLDARLLGTPAVVADAAARDSLTDGLSDAEKLAFHGEQRELASNSQTSGYDSVSDDWVQGAIAGNPTIDDFSASSWELVNIGSDNLYAPLWPKISSLGRTTGSDGFVYRTSVNAISTDYGEFPDKAQLDLISGVHGGVALLSDATRYSYDSSLSSPAWVLWDGVSPIAANTSLDPVSLVRSWRREYLDSKTITPSEFGAIGDGIADDTAAIAAACHWMRDGDTLDLEGKTYNFFVGNVGTEPTDVLVDPENAIEIEDTPRVFGKRDIRVRNGAFTADDPTERSSLVNYPTTFSVDSCVNVELDNIKFYSKGKNWGDTDASFPMSDKNARRLYAIQNGGHAFFVVYSQHVTLNKCQFRRCGSVGAFYSMSSDQIILNGCFSNAEHLGYGAYAIDSWAGDTSITGFPSHYLELNNCSTHKEGANHGSKNCVITEDIDVEVVVFGGFYADAIYNGSARDIGAAFGTGVSLLRVYGARVHNCAAVGYMSASTNHKTKLVIDGVVATGLLKTVHQNRETSLSEFDFKYSNCEFEVVGGGTWSSDPNSTFYDASITRTNTSYCAMVNSSNPFRGEFNNCTFKGAEYCVLADSDKRGKLLFSDCHIETHGYLYNIQGFGTGVEKQGKQKGLYYENCSIVDLSFNTDPYTSMASSLIYTQIDLSTSTITLKSVRDIETSSTPSPGLYIEKYSFPRIESEQLDVSVNTYLTPVSAKVINATNSSGSHKSIYLTRADKYKYMDFVINNEGPDPVRVRDYSGVLLIEEVVAGSTVKAIGNGASYSMSYLSTTNTFDALSKEPLSGVAVTVAMALNDTEFADNAAAIAGGLSVGDRYWTNTGEFRRVV